jgi:ferredoxin-NADP reductase
MKAKIIEKKEIAQEILYVRFATDEDLNFTAGQFFSLTLINPPFSDSRGNSRFFGFVNSPTQNRTIEMVTCLGMSSFKKTLSEMPLGTEVEIGSIGGTINLPSDTAKPLIFITEGIGIAPLMSIIRLVNEKSLAYKITLIYSNKDKASAVFLDELESIANSNPDFKLIATMIQDNNWTGEKRRIDTQLLKEYLSSVNDNLYFVTGTSQFVPNIIKALLELGVIMGQIKLEVFTGY